MKHPMSAIFARGSNYPTPLTVKNLIISDGKAGGVRGQLPFTRMELI
jgi:hypothetical protein